MVGTIATNRAAAEERIFATFGQAFERNMGALASVSMPEARKELGASRLALEHAVMKAAVLNNAPTTAIAGKLGQPGNQELTRRMIDAGRNTIQKTFGRSADSLGAVLAGKTLDIDLPRGLAQTEDVRQLVNEGKKLVGDMVMDGYMNRGRLQIDSQRSNFASMAPNDRQGELKERLVNHLAFIGSAIEHGVKTGRLPAEDGKFLQQRIEHQIFTSADSGKLSQGFKDFQDATVPRLRAELTQEAQTRTKHPAIEAATAKLYQQPEPAPSPLFGQAKPADQQKEHSGRVVDIDGKHVYQELGRNNIVRHDRAAFGQQLPERGQTVKVAYQQGRAQVVARAPAREQQKGVER
ncbi:MAG: hypothetical protein KA742_00540 [Pseudoxanthomonas sp.]|nr:hypothetical protein [Pseudoxanthomonas sp.]